MLLIGAARTVSASTTANLLAIFLSTSESPFERWVRWAETRDSLGLFCSILVEFAYPKNRLVRTDFPLPNASLRSA
jgi:hypothetical protein